MRRSLACIGDGGGAWIAGFGGGGGGWIGDYYFLCVFLFLLMVLVCGACIYEYLMIAWRCLEVVCLLLKRIYCMRK